MTCRTCDGSGVVDAWEDRWSHTTGHYTVDISYDCPDCDAGYEAEVERDRLEAEAEDAWEAKREDSRVCDMANETRSEFETDRDVDF